MEWLLQSRIRILLSNICLGLALVIAVAVAYGCSGPPVAVFQASAISGQAPLSVTFTNQSRNADVFTWDFGDGEKQTTSTLIEATSHQYEKAGTFTATLTAAKKSNSPQTNSTTATITVSPGPLAQVIVGPGQIDLGMGMTQQFVAVGADQYANRISGLTFTWSVQSGAGTIDSKGLFTAPTAPGTNAKAVRAQATLGTVTVSGTADVTVEPDRIAFFSTRANAKGDLYMMNSDGTNVVRISEGLTSSTYIASWSPDGRRLAVDGTDPTKDVSSIIISDDTGDWGFVASGEQDAAFPAWSPDGRRIAYAANVDDQVEIFVMDEDGGNVTRLTNNTWMDFAPTWSPDGTRLAYFSDRDGNFQIYVMTADGSGQRRLVTDTFENVMPYWSPDGKQIVFQTSAPMQVWFIAMVNADGTGLKQLTADPYDANNPSWSPDGKKIVFDAYKDGDTYHGIYTMDPDGQNIIRISGPTADAYGARWAPRKKGVSVNEASLVIPDSKALKPLTVQQITAQARKAVVRIETDLGKGSGFIIDPNGLILTANHVISDAKEINVFLDDGTKYTGTIKGRDLVRDIAIVEIKATGLSFLKLGDLGQSGLGSPALVLGYALGSKDLSATSGLLSAIKQDNGHNITWLQTDSAINPGNSGGPMLNLQGEVIGVVTSKIVATGIEGVGFAVSVNTVDIYLARMEDGETIFQ